VFLFYLTRRISFAARRCRKTCPSARPILRPVMAAPALFLHTLSGNSFCRDRPGHLMVHFSLPATGHFVLLRRCRPDDVCVIFPSEISDEPGTVFKETLFSVFSRCLPPALHTRAVLTTTFLFALLRRVRQGLCGRCLRLRHRHVLHRRWSCQLLESRILRRHRGLFGYVDHSRLR